MKRLKQYSKSQQLKTLNNSIPWLETSKFPWPVLKGSFWDQEALSDGIQHQKLQSHALQAWWGNQSNCDTQLLDQLLPLRKETCEPACGSVSSVLINKGKNESEEQSSKEQRMESNPPSWVCCYKLGWWHASFVKLSAALLLTPKEHWGQENSRRERQLWIENVINTERLELWYSFRLGKKPRIEMGINYHNTALEFKTLLSARTLLQSTILKTQI